jgi:hypothetical protein
VRIAQLNRSSCTRVPIKFRDTPHVRTLGSCMKLWSCQWSCHFSEPLRRCNRQSFVVVPAPHPTLSIFSSSCRFLTSFRWYIHNGFKQIRSFGLYRLGSHTTWHTIVQYSTYSNNKCCIIMLHNNITVLFTAQKKERTGRSGLGFAWLMVSISLYTIYCSSTGGYIILASPLI